MAMAEARRKCFFLKIFRAMGLGVQSVNMYGWTKVTYFWGLCMSTMYGWELFFVGKGMVVVSLLVKGDKKFFFIVMINPFLYEIFTGLGADEVVYGDVSHCAWMG